jgi:hypothetical protein
VKTVISIVPRLPPAIDGVGDYSLSLAKRLRLEFNIQTHFIVSDPSWSGESEIAGFPITQVRDRTKNSLLEILNNRMEISSVLVHYVLHSYHKKGCPFWLIEALETWKKQKPEAYLVSMFHEIYSMGSGVVPWNTDFWLLPWQKQLAKRLYMLSNRSLTSSQRYADLLKLQATHLDLEISTIPIFSNIGEPDKTVSLEQRKKRLVIFGQRGNKAKVYMASQQVAKISYSFGIQEILDIGPELLHTPEVIAGVPIKKMGSVSSEKISRILQDSLGGLLSYDPERLAKSSIFSAYCSHGVLPINLQSPSSAVDKIDGLTAGHNYLTACLCGESIKPLSDWQEVADAAKAWYEKHNQSATAQLFAKSLLPKNSYACLT